MVYGSWENGYFTERQNRPRIVLSTASPETRGHHQELFNPKTRQVELECLAGPRYTEGWAFVPRSSEVRCVERKKEVRQWFSRLRSPISRDPKKLTELVDNFGLPFAADIQDWRDLPVVPVFRVQQEIWRYQFTLWLFRKAREGESALPQAWFHTYKGKRRMKLQNRFKIGLWYCELRGIELPSHGNPEKAQSFVDFLSVRKLVAQEINQGLKCFPNQPFLIQEEDGGFAFRSNPDTFLSFLWKDLARRFASAAYIDCEECGRQTEARSVAKTKCRSCINKAYDSKRSGQRRKKASNG